MATMYMFILWNIRCICTRMMMMDDGQNRNVFKMILKRQRSFKNMVNFALKLFHYLHWHPIISNYTSLVIFDNATEGE